MLKLKQKKSNYSKMKTFTVQIFKKNLRFIL